ncbi:phosphoribosylformylglycinamidine synthase I [Prosthecochloris sp. N3]|uniref:Phosphoribosylformylglycinamidine synthase subunit PurQ n=1 Tax=Prosthecochloris ethylica TaxID=2743976 RepID=A0ABR9XQK9_9CHLB|nr:MULTISPECIES: phosphoribosylformylglycinamidine synthase I [Prosthecochloris]MEC9486734.1 phosphoribosylformylglycinamidine synthase I [Prosthecochloris sp.]MBF0585478.1 phosphoribosylformylglycinamidine synthase I [Prosthecochloris ethylica]MBF0636264.1 phosphoribosylformylglycinamidine synthase I [Prosthecochloris ethylica]NUK46708.1 phosphoribosylformylglycinamidine synthase I [Prosthecochloris ethylica]RNA64707.1 phosphoribosylformylglycinamidine synthase I [Prosthecochloris sp. ZM_2]
MAEVTIGVVVFPGSNCDHDTEFAAASFPGVETRMLWHNEHDLQGSDMVVLPGGFSYGDYLRAGSIAKFSPIMREVIDFAAKGRPVLGICNGFQVLLECGLLEGALTRNRDKKFICRFMPVKVVNNRTLFTSLYQQDEVLNLPVAHGEGNYYAPPETLERLVADDQVVFRYCDEHGNVSDEANLNGSVDAIAGLSNKEKNVLGLMPHPERASDSLLGSDDGRRMFRSAIDYLSGI